MPVWTTLLDWSCERRLCLLLCSYYVETHTLYLRTASERFRLANLGKRERFGKLARIRLGILRKTRNRPNLLPEC